MVTITENRANMTYCVRVVHGNDAKEYEFFVEDLNDIAEIVISDRIRAMKTEIAELEHQLDIVTKANNPALRGVERSTQADV